jgi:NitT/TauT family transport system substrate-binding protein
MRLKAERAERWSRREFSRALAVAGTAGLIGLRPGAADADPPLETTTLRLWEGPIACIAPHYAAKELLHAEGFTDVQYVRSKPNTVQALVSREVDITVSFIPLDVVGLDAAAPIVILAGSHIGCIELVAARRVGSLVELKGKAVAVSELRGSEHIFISLFIAHVGLDPKRDVNWVVAPVAEHVGLLESGKIDAFMSGPPFSQELRAKKIGHVLLNTTVDRPWSQYFCCVVASSKTFVSTHPVATKRALRAIVKAADVCALEPNRVARDLVNRGLWSREDYILQMLKEMPYNRWRQYDPEDAVRFYALRLHEVGMVQSSPNKIVGHGTDWRFLNELKRELKA